MSVKNILGNWIIKNLLIALVVVLVLAVGANFFLGYVTKHNQELMVPDLTGMTLADAAVQAANLGVRIDVVDSIYVKRVPKGSIVRQEPKPGSMVKKGRRLQLTINAVNAKKVPMPNLVGYSLRSANAELVSRGLELGRLVYVSDMATNNVIRQLYRNREINPGVMINSESRIDLVLGLNPDENYTTVPDLGGYKYKLAVEKIHDHSLNVGTVRFDKGIRTYQDSLNAVIYRQVPDPMTDMSIGESVSIYLTLDADKVPNLN